MSNSYHKSAIIDPSASIGKNVRIGPFCLIGPNVTIKDNVELKSHVVIEGITTIGEGTVIYPFASIGHCPQDLKYKGEPSKVIIGKNNTIREYVTIQPGTKAGGMATIVGDNCLLMVGVHIAHDCTVGNNVIFANYATLAGHVQVGDYAILGGLSAVLQYVKVGQHSIVGGVSALVRDLVPFGLAANDRAHLEGLNLIGMNRRGFDKKESLEASKAVEEIFTFDEGSFDERVAKALGKYKNNSIVQQIVKFLKQDTTRAFCVPKKH